MSKKMLVGALEITQRMGVSEASFIDLIQQKGLPAKKNDANVYEISVADLEKWEKRHVVEVQEKSEKESAEPAKPTAALKSGKGKRKSKYGVK